MLKEIDAGGKTILDRQFSCGKKKKGVVEEEEKEEEQWMRFIDLAREPLSYLYSTPSDMQRTIGPEAMVACRVELQAQVDGLRRSHGGLYVFLSTNTKAKQV